MLIRTGEKHHFRSSKFSNFQTTKRINSYLNQLEPSATNLKIVSAWQTNTGISITPAAGCPNDEILKYKQQHMDKLEATGMDLDAEFNKKVICNCIMTERNFSWDLECYSKERTDIFGKATVHVAWLKKEEEVKKIQAGAEMYLAS